MKNILLSLLVVTVSCKAQTQAPLSKSKDLIKDKSAKNVALLFSGDNSGGIAAGVASDMRIMNEFMPKIGFTDTRTFDLVGKSQLYEESKKGAAVVSNSGTMFWFIDTHGSPQGDLSLGDRSFTRFDNVASEMRRQRNDVSFKRLVVFIEACFSGNNVDGNTSITKNTGNGQNSNEGSGNFDYGFALQGNQQLALNGNQPASNQNLSGSSIEEMLNNFLGQPTGNSQPPAVANSSSSQSTPLPSPLATPSADTTAQPMKGVLYEEAIIIASSTSAEYSWLGGDGSAAVKGFMEAVNEACASLPTITVGQFLSSFKAKVQALGSGNQAQTPVFKLEPESLKSERMFSDADCQSIKQNPVSGPWGIPNSGQYDNEY